MVSTQLHPHPGEGAPKGAGEGGEAVVQIAAGLTQKPIHALLLPRPFPLMLMASAPGQEAPVGAEVDPEAAAVAEAEVGAVSSADLNLLIRMTLPSLCKLTKALTMDPNSGLNIRVWHGET